jgi:hypothetical protein
MTTTSTAILAKEYFYQYELHHSADGARTGHLDDFKRTSMKGDDIEKGW